ncbi:MAG: serine/threonine protein kinase [Deltaproteobacteria bacterium]|nr:serine/threonine protein kinase [Deltaproteobacteria bacterium]
MEPFCLGNYRVLRELGRGGMGVVYLADDLVLHRLVAIKVLHPHLTQDPEFKKRFMVEARNQAQLTHPNITTLYSFEEKAGQIFLVMEYLEGETLEKCLQRLSRLSRPEMQQIFPQVLEAVAYAHAKGVIHRDLKPGNIAITRTGTVKIMDFGIAIQVGADKGFQPTEILGTPHYMAPEQIKGEPLSPSTDIYALGVILFEMVTGRPPFDGPTDHDIRVAHVTKKPMAPRLSGCPDINPELEGVILKALEKDPRKRFVSAQELLLALETSLNGPPEATSFPPSISAATSPSFPRRQKRVLTWPLAPVALIIFTLGAILLEAPLYFKKMFYQGDQTGSGGSPPSRVPLPAGPEPQPAALASLQPSSPVTNVPHKTDPAPVPSPADPREALCRTLKEHGFGHLKVEGVAPQISVIGQVRSLKEKNQVMRLATVHCPTQWLEFKDLKIRQALARTALPKAPPEDLLPESRRTVVSPTLPMAPPEDIRFGFGKPTVTKIR